MPRLLRITTVPISLHLLLRGQFGYMRDKGFDVTTISADGREVTEVVKDGTKHIVIPFTRKITPIHDLICLWKLVREIRKLRPDIVHTHTPKAGLLGMLAAWICRVPVRLHTVAGLPLMEARGMKRQVLVIAEKITYACAHRIYPNSQGLKKFLQRQLQVPVTKLKILGNGSSNGIDTTYFDRTPELENQAREVRLKNAIQEEDLVFSFVGRIVRDKGIVELVQAFKALSNDMDTTDNSVSRKKLALILVGHFEEDLDPLPPDVKAFLMNDEHVIVAGFQPDVRPWLIASNIFVFPSYREGFPNVVMQAGLLGVPSIVSDINGCNEIIKNNVTGLVVPAKDVVALTRAMKIMVNDKIMRSRLAIAARDFVTVNFKREFIWEQLKNEYETLIKN